MECPPRYKFDREYCGNLLIFLYLIYYLKLKFNYAILDCVCEEK